MGAVNFRVLFHLEKFVNHQWHLVEYDNVEKPELVSISQNFGLDLTVP